MSAAQTDVTPYFDLNTWPLWSPDQATHEPLGEAIRIMKLSGFRKLVFAIVRSTADDQDAWDRLVARVRQNAFDHLGIRQELLGRFLGFPVLEGSGREEGQGGAVDLDEARTVFKKWSRSNTPSAFDDLPCFKYSVHVDKTCLDSLVKRETWEAENPEIADLWTGGPPCFVKLVRAEQERPKKDGSWMMEDIASIRRQAEQIAAANPHMAEAVFAELASAEAAVGFTHTNAGNLTEFPSHATGEASNNASDESEDESVAADLSEQDSRWFYIHVAQLLEMYNTLHDHSNWDLWYMRPPEVSRG